MIRCDICDRGKLGPKVVKNFDASALLGIPITIDRMNAQVCDHCKAVFPEGQEIERLSVFVLRDIVLGDGRISWSDARFLRKYLGLTQEALGKRLGASRITIARWETKLTKTPLSGTNALALRGLVAARLLLENHLDARELSALKAPHLKTVRKARHVTAKELRAVA